jgi:site-specific DNA-cytosine methylase
VNVGSLFSGIGGFDLGFERAGMRVSWQVELDPYCRAVLARHFPDAARFDDVREVGARNLAPVDLLCGGFPCQDLSPAGKGAGLDGARSGLWAEFARIVRELRPRYVVVENVPALLTGKGKRWDRAPVGRVLGDLAEAGYDAEWACLSAREFGAPHLRKRIWIVAYPARDAEAGAAAESRSERERAGAGGERTERRTWPTPKASASGPDFARARRKRSGGDDLATAVAREELWPTPINGAGQGGRQLREAVARGSRLPTPTRQDARNNGAPSQSRRRTRLLNSIAGGPLNPEWVEWLMGFPVGWTALPPSVTPSSRRSRSGSGDESSTTSAARTKRERGG